MKKALTFAAVAVLVVVTGGGGSVHAQSGGTIPFEAADLKVEINATDKDAGLQIFLDHDAWRSIAISKPDGTKIVDFDTRSQLRNYGLTELFSESSEPNFKEFPLSKFKKLFPEGKYLFVGETTDGVRMRSRVPLTHNFPSGPSITAPADGSTVSKNNLVVDWDPVNEAGIVGYQVVVEKEDPLRVLQADLPKTVTEFPVPEAYLESGTEFKAEVLAIEKSGNQTLHEVSFKTS